MSAQTRIQEWPVVPELESEWLGETRGAEASAVQLAIKQGVTDESRLTDLVFQGRHPERAGRPIAKGDQVLVQEWLSIRDQVVRPLRAGGVAATATPTAPAAPAGAFRPVPVESPGGGRIRDKRDPSAADLVTVRGAHGPIQVHRIAAQAWTAMLNAARADGIPEPLLRPGSGYRSSTHQAALFRKAVERYGSPEKARKWVAPPGSSAHQSGRAFDLYVGGETDSSKVAVLRRMPAYLWLVANAQRFGFYPYEAEPWHWEYNPPAVQGEAELEEARPSGPPIPASRLEWPGATPEQLAFMRSVYERHFQRSLARSGRKGARAFVADLPPNAVEPIEGQHVARTDASRAGRALLTAARAALAQQGLAGRIRIGIVSAYRPAAYQFVIWQGKGRRGGFPYYYRDAVHKGIVAPGDYGRDAVDRVVAHLGKFIGAPGFSNHQAGLAIDFGTGEVGGGLGKIGARSWLHQWLTENAARFGFHPLATETWHWDYRPPPPAAPVSHEIAAVTTIRAGRLEVPKVPALESHRGKAPALILRWNDMPAAPAEIDVVVHLHGYSRPWLNLPRDIEPYTGLDLTPVGGAEGRGRSRPTLTVLPRAHYTGVKQAHGNLYMYTFPALDGSDGRKDGLNRLVQFSLERFAAENKSAPPRVARLILTAHSGGGAPLVKMLRFLDPQEVHVYDALYWEPSALIEWARKHIRRDAEAPGALRVFYGGGTRPYSRRVAHAIASEVGAGLADRYRVEASTFGHWEIPRNYGWRVLADPSADVPRAKRETAPAVRRELGELEGNGGGWISTFTGTAQATAAIARGERDPNRITDIVFNGRHPERGGRPITRQDPQLGLEWRSIRDTIVQPALLRATAAPVATVATGAPGQVPDPSHFRKRARDPRRYALLTPLLDRYRGDIPLEYLLGWISVESDACIDEVTSLDERGFFQIHPDESHDRHFDHQRLTTDVDYSVKAGIDNVRYYAQLARQRYPEAPPGSELHWRLVKFQHAMGAGLALKVVQHMRARGIPIVWGAIKQYELSDEAQQIHRLLRKEPGRFAHNVDEVFKRGAKLAASLGR